MLAVAKRDPKLRHGLRILRKNGGKVLLLRLRNCGDGEELPETGLPHQIGLREQIGGPMLLQARHNFWNLKRKSRPDDVLLHRSFKRARLEFGRERKDERCDALHQPFDEREVPGRIEQRVRQR
jgi:hypothetical protein